MDNFCYNKFPKIAWFLLLILAQLILFPPAAKAANVVRASLLTDTFAVNAGEDIKLQLLLDTPEGWHTYYKEPGDAGLPTRIEWKLPEGFSAGEIEWPAPSKFSEGGLTTYGYSGQTILPVTLKAPDKISEQSYNFVARAQWLVCAQICIPEEQIVSLEIPAGKKTPADKAEAIKEASPVPLSFGLDLFSLLATLTAALIGGIILNVMPCVLPILSLKALSLVKKSGHVRAHTAKYGIAYTLGVLFSFLIIALFIIGLQQGGQAVGWGFQMQSPVFVGFLIYLLFLVGLNLSGAFYLPVIFGGLGRDISHGNSMRGSFFTGILATLVATPCTAPFMASAVGAALLLPPWAALMVFLTLGFGLALPFLLISIFPSLLRFLPRPGAWMEQFKEFLAFPIYASVVWLLWVLGRQTGIDGVALSLCGLLLIIFMIWVQKVNSRCNIFFRSFFLVAAMIMLMAIIFALGKINIVAGNSIPYSSRELSRLRDEHKAVYVDVTAAWCITCQLNKNIALDTKNTQAAFKDNDVTLMVADWTNRNPEITSLLHSFGYNGVPLNVFYPKDGSAPIILPQILSEKIVIETVSK
jgi:thiol:disulfide interchange protein DsbD